MSQDRHMCQNYSLESLYINYSTYSPWGASLSIWLCYIIAWTIKVIFDQKHFSNQILCPKLTVPKFPQCPIISFKTVIYQLVYFATLEETLDYLFLLYTSPNNKILSYRNPVLPKSCPTESCLSQSLPTSAGMPQKYGLESLYVNYNTYAPWGTPWDT